MTAEPPAAAPDDADQLRTHRQVAESFGGDAARYDRVRPSYPDALIERIVAASPGPDVLDVGCGTGIEARQFRSAGCAVLGIDPDERMAEFARSTGVEVEVATIEAWEPAGRQFDAVVAGTAWHWVDPIAGAVKAGQVLRPGGLITPFHHVFTAPPEILDAMAAARQRVAPDGPPTPPSRPQGLDLYQPLFDKIADGIRAAQAFSEPDQWHFDWERVYTTDDWLDQIPTFGGLTLLPADALAAVQTSAGEVIDAMGGSFTMAYTTVAVVAVRT